MLRTTLPACLLLLLLANPAPGARAWRVPAEAPTIAAGLDSASAGDTVRVDCGTYAECDLVLKSGVVLRSATGLAGCVVLDAGELGGHLYGADLDTNTVVEGFTFRRGNGVFTADTGRFGGAVRLHGSSPRIRHCAFDSNSAVYGGALFCSLSSPRVEHCSFAGNDAVGDGAVSVSRSGPTFLDCTFADNWAFEGAGAVWCANGSAAAFAGCEFLRNVTTEEGGGIACREDSRIDVSGCTFRDNVTEAPGGGILLMGDGTVDDCLFAGNSGDGGGGIYASGDTIAVSGSVFHANAAGALGGGICFGIGYGSAGQDLVASGCTFVANAAAGGGACVATHDEAVSRLEHCILALGTLGEAARCDGTSSLALSCCDVFGNAGGDFVGCLEGLEGMDGNFAADPLFCDPAAGDFTLHANSPCLPEHNGCGVLVGALGEGCGISAAGGDESPARLALGSRPNPFNPTSVIAFELPAAARVGLRIHDLGGRLVRVLVADEVRSAGRHEVRWNGRDAAGRAVASGLYICRLQAGDRVAVHRLTLVR
jgi:predicted outer membrane repeat protein